MIGDTIGVCIITQKTGMSFVLKCVENVYGYVDDVLIQTEDDISEFNDVLTKYNVHVLHEPWKDSFADYKNKSLARTNAAWAMSIDHDEVITPTMAQGLRQIVKGSYHGTKYDIVEFRCQTFVDGVGGPIASGKPLLQVNYRNPFHGLCHNHLRSGLYRGTVRSDLYYEHHKTSRSILRNAIRNVDLGGGGDNFENKSGLWTPLREWCSVRGINTYRQLLDYMDVGNVDLWFKDWMEKASILEWHDDEYMAFKKYYYSMHPEEQ